MRVQAVQERQVLAVAQARCLVCSLIISCHALVGLPSAVQTLHIEVETYVCSVGLYTDESPGLKVDPVVVLVLSIVFIFSVVALHGMR
jgi:hypothetical protein